MIDTLEVILFPKKGTSKSSLNTTHEYFMCAAINEAKKALKYDEIPVGAVIVKNGIIISKGYNEREHKQDSTLHAEITAIKRACRKLGSWRLNDCDIYVTLEPCAMCAGAIIQSRISRLFIGTPDPKAGAAGSVVDVFEADLFNHNVQVEFGIRKKECASLLKDFFKNLRASK
jgi:tRNA(adenine34) deaminase